MTIKSVKTKTRITNFLDILKRKILVLLCFSVAGFVILHLLTNDTKHPNELTYRRKLSPIPSREHNQSRNDGVTPLSFNEGFLDASSNRIDAVGEKFEQNYATPFKNTELDGQTNYDCEYEGLGGAGEGVHGHQSLCIPYKRTEEECNRAFEFFDYFDLDSEPVKCQHSPIDDPICTFQTHDRLGINDRLAIECDPSICEDDDVLVGCRDTNYGIIPKESFWLRFKSIESLQEKLPSIIKKNSLRGMNFCFFKCANDENQQPLIFPPLLKASQTSMKGRDKINVNILVEDAVSRAHFYRSLPQTANLLRKLKNSKTSKVRILDFELVQSYASFTVVNLRALFGGNTLSKKSLKERNSGIDGMARRYQQRGFQTLIQEDLCFFDQWGSVLAEKYKGHLEPFSESFKRAFQEYSMRTRYVDNRGLSHFACEAMRSYGYTNPYRHLAEICSNGKFVSQYLLEYVEDFLRGVENQKNAAPAFVYTHLNTAHESKGTRIRGDDIPLEAHIKAVSQLQNTITIILSDHGSKTTKYSMDTFDGRLEVFSPLMFMIVPENVAKILGRSRVQTLIANQKRLASLVDLHGMLNSLVEIPSASAPATTDYRVSGLLSPIPLNRTCSDLEGLKSDVYCRCKGWNRFISTSSPEVHWLAEIAVGHINNIITRQFTKSRRSKSDQFHIGYGACARFLGKSIETARQEISGDYIIIMLLLVVTPAYGVDSVERFEVKLNYSSLGQPNVQVMDIVRISVYGKYKACADKTVDVKLCACADPKSTASTARRRLDLRQLLQIHHFGLKTSVKFLSSRCLLLGERTLRTIAIDKLQARVIAFEIANQCRRTFKLKLSGSSKRSRVSRPLPFTLALKSRTVVFLYAVYNEWKYGRFKPLVNILTEN